MSASSSRVSCGLDFQSSADINECLDKACKAGFDFLSLPIVHPRNRREFLETPAKTRPGPLTRSDLLLTSSDWTSLIVGKISPWLQLDSDNYSIRKNSEQAFIQETQFCTHLCLPALLIQLTSSKCHNFARTLNNHLSGSSNQQVWLHVPMQAPVDACDQVVDFGQEQTDREWTDDTWQWWNTVRTICHSSKRLGLALEISTDLPSKEVLDRWCGEPVKAAILNTSIFLTNKKGFPVLPRSHQAFIKCLFKLDTQLILTGVSRHPGKGIKAYHQYLDHFYQNQGPVDVVTQFAKGYEDYLQSPLQPLMDNLESQTYETFEKDPFKYAQYEKAVFHALVDRVPDDKKHCVVTVVMVVGAGRGPLVRASISAAKKCQRLIRVYAVEKNPNAVVTLENIKQEEWGDTVSVVSCDMRQWQAPEKADILVSELLGSFGDNELSPECLDGAQRFLKEDGISIPMNYTSYLAPLQSSKLYNEARGCREHYKHPDTPFEMPYVVRLHNCHVMAEPQPVFKFVHPKKDNSDNSRYVSLTFNITQCGVLHGFAGYFDSELYKDIWMSILPATHSANMFSWFPIYFPIRDPVYVEKDSKVTVHFWRCVTPKNCWYEWCITEPQVHPIHNPRGRSYTIGL